MKKKNNRGAAIVKLVIWFVVLIVLVAALTVGFIFRGSFIFNGMSSFSIISSYAYENAAKYSAGNAVYTDNVKNIDIEWTSGKVKIAVYDGDEVKLSESGAGERDENKMRTYLEGGTLHVRYAKSGIRRFSSMPTKELTVYLPVKYASALRNVDITSVSADIVTQGDIVCQKLNVELVSGKLNVEKINAGRIDIDTVSGNMSVNGNVGELDISGVSAKAYLCFETAPHSIDLETVSGDVEITLPKGASFRAELDGVSGSMKVDSKDVGKYYNIGNGTSEFDFETVSGDVKIMLK